jgi:competence protein ComEC
MMPWRAVAASALPALRRLDALARRAAELAAEERDRWPLWLPVGLGIGIGTYFSLPAEPPPWLGWAAVGAPAAAAALQRRRPERLALWVAVATVALGFAAAQARTLAVQAPMLVDRLGPTGVVGRVAAVESFPEAKRVTVERLRVAGLGPERTPESVRVSLRGPQPRLEPGDWVRLRAVLMPPAAPAAPGAFDFQRQAYFMGLGAVGFGLGPAAVTARAAGEGTSALALGLQRLRQRITERVLAGLEGQKGAMAAAMMTGDRSAISAEAMAAMRDSGLAHLLAISGLNIGLVAGIVFVGVRAALALAPPLALRYPIKKWAAVAAIPAAFAYALVAGLPVPTQRAALMAGLMMLAVLVDRRALSMWLCAWAAVVVLLAAPESLLGASFQMSFAAVVALIAAYEEAQRRRRFRDGARPWPRALLVYLAGVALTTLVAGLATAPFAAYHFNRYADYALIANMIAVPATGLWVMPWIVATFALLPFGLEKLALVPLGWGFEVVIGTAETVAAWPGAVTVVPAMPAWGLAAVALGGLWLCLWRRRWRLIGVAGIAAGLASVAWTTPPDVLVDGQGRLLAVRTADGGLSVSAAGRARATQELWARRLGEAEAESGWPRAGTSADGRLACDAEGCIYRVGAGTVALVKEASALAEDCRRAHAVVSVVPIRRPCPGPLAVIDRFDLWRNGAHALWIEPGGVRVESANAARGDRPWVLRPEGRGKSAKQRGAPEADAPADEDDE